MNKTCTKCHKVQPLEQFNKDLTKNDRLHSHCKLCMSKNAKHWWENNRERILKERGVKVPKSRLARKIRVLTYYSYPSLEPRCVKCGFSNPYALSIDHINGSGNKHRKSLGYKTSDGFYMWLEKENYPNGFQTLCMNCQWIKKFERQEF